MWVWENEFPSFLSFSLIQSFFKIENKTFFSLYSDVVSFVAADPSNQMQKVPDSQKIFHTTFTLEGHFGFVCCSVSSFLTLSAVSLNFSHLWFPFGFWEQSTVEC